MELHTGIIHRKRTNPYPVLAPVKKLRAEETDPVDALPSTSGISKAITVVHALLLTKCSGVESVEKGV